jgi:hypothetical protein
VQERRAKTLEFLAAAQLPQPYSSNIPEALSAGRDMSNTRSRKYIGSTSSIKAILGTPNERCKVALGRSRRSGQRDTQLVRYLPANNLS